MDRRTFLASGSTALAFATGLPTDRAVAITAAAGEGASSANPVAATVVSRFGSDGAALQRAIDTNAREIIVDLVVTVTVGIQLRSDQNLRFVNGKIVVPPDATIAEAVLYNRGGRNITLIAPVIEVQPRRGDGITAIKLLDAIGSRISGGRLVRANLIVEGSDNTRPSLTRIEGLDIALNGVAATALYISGLRDVAIRDVTCSGGIEGVGVYNNARDIVLHDVTAHGHRQDGFLINAGQRIAHIGCRAYDNGQSGFTTQRQTAGDDSRFASWSGCSAWNNRYDGFDIRGATGVPWGIDTAFVLTRCSARGNRECGFYVVKAEGTTLVECVGILNGRQNLFIDTSDRVTATNFRSISGAARVAVGPNKAGILIFASANARLKVPASGNGAGKTQQFGLSFTGNSRDARVTGGEFSDNLSGAAIGGDGAIMLRQ